LGWLGLRLASAPMQIRQWQPYEDGNFFAQSHLQQFDFE